MYPGIQLYLNIEVDCVIRSHCSTAKIHHICGIKCMPRCFTLNQQAGYDVVSSLNRHGRVGSFSESQTPLDQFVLPEVHISCIQTVHYGMKYKTAGPKTTNLEVVLSKDESILNILSRINHNPSPAQTATPFHPSLAVSARHAVISINVEQSQRLGSVFS